MRMADCEAVLQAVERHYAQHGVPPTLREIDRATGLGSTSQVRLRLEHLVMLGRLVRAGGLKSARAYVPPRARCIELLQTGLSE